MGRRLFPLLPQDEEGPAVVEFGNGSCLTGDLRIDNRDEIIGLLGNRFRRVSDLQLLARLVDELGVEQSLSRIVGDFAFAFWDSACRKLILARDFLGQRPLHYHVHSDHVAFASMPKGLHALDVVERAASREALTDFLLLLPDSPDQSFFANIAKVPPGHWIEIDNSGQLRSTPYWKPELEPLVLPNAEAYEEALLAHFDEAVKARLRGCGDRVATHLSSGLDSSSVTASAARLMNAIGGRVTALTAVPSEGAQLHVAAHEIGDEGPLAAQTASLYPNIDHVRVCPPNMSALANLERHFQLFDRPPLNPVNHGWIDAVNDAARGAGLPVLLTGQKGNMTASYSGLPLLPRLLREGKLIPWIRLARQVSQAGMRPKNVVSRSVAPLLPGFAWRLYMRAWKMASAVREYSLLRSEDHDWKDLDRRARRVSRDLLYQPWWNGQQMRLWAIRRTDMGNYNKGMLGGWGVDHRDPTADRRLVEYCLRIPEEMFIRDGIPRSLIRGAFRGRLPADVVGNRKLGVQAADWHLAFSKSRASFEAAAERLSALDREQQLVDIDRLKKLVRDWPSDWRTRETLILYRHAAPRAVSAMNFLRYAAGLN